MRGRMILKVTGILMIIGGFGAVVFGIISIIGLLALYSLSGATGIMPFISTIIIIVAGIVEFIAGIIGVKNCDNPKKANLCLVFGIIVIILAAGGQILGLIRSEVIVTNMIMIIVSSIVLPIVYIVGAVLNKTRSE